MAISRADDQITISNPSNFPGPLFLHGLFDQFMFKQDFESIKGLIRSYSPYLYPKIVGSENFERLPKDLIALAGYVLTLEFPANFDPFLAQAAKLKTLTILFNTDRLDLTEACNIRFCFTILPTEHILILIEQITNLIHKTGYKELIDDFLAINFSEKGVPKVELGFYDVGDFENNLWILVSELIAADYFETAYSLYLLLAIKGWVNESTYQEVNEKAPLSFILFTRKLMTRLSDNQKFYLIEKLHQNIGNAFIKSDNDYEYKYSENNIRSEWLKFFAGVFANLAEQINLNTLRFTFEALSSLHLIIIDDSPEKSKMAVRNLLSICESLPQELSENDNGFFLRLLSTAADLATPQSHHSYQEAYRARFTTQVKKKLEDLCDTQFNFIKILKIHPQSSSGPANSSSSMTPSLPNLSQLFYDLRALLVQCEPAIKRLSLYVQPVGYFDKKTQRSQDSLLVDVLTKIHAIRPNLNVPGATLFFQPILNRYHNIILTKETLSPYPYSIFPSPHHYTNLPQEADYEVAKILLSSLLNFQTLFNNLTVNLLEMNQLNLYKPEDIQITSGKRSLSSTSLVASSGSEESANKKRKGASL